MSDDVTARQGAWKWWCCAPAAGVLLLAVVGGAIAGLADPSKREATAACEQVALLRGETSELVDVETEHVRADAYTVTGTVVTPGLPDEDFTGRATQGPDGDYVCELG